MLVDHQQPEFEQAHTLLIYSWSNSGACAGISRVIDAMNNYLDMRTLLFVVSLLGLVICLAFVYVQTTRKTYAGFCAWTLSSFASFAGLLLASLRGAIPDLGSIVLGGVLIVSTVVFIAYGLDLFLAQPVRWKYYVVLMVMTTAGFLFFTYVLPSVNARIVIVSGAIIVIDLWCAFLVWNGVARMLGGHNLFLIAAFMLSALLNAVRFVLAAFYDPIIPDLMAASHLHAVTLLLMTGVHIFMNLGLLLLNFQRVEQDLSVSLDEIKILKGIIPICASCKKVRDDKGAWNQIESYIRDHSEAEFSHGICPDCISKLYPGIDDSR